VDAAGGARSAGIVFSLRHTGDSHRHACHDLRLLFKALSQAIPLFGVDASIHVETNFRPPWADRFHPAILPESWWLSPDGCAHPSGAHPYPGVVSSQQAHRGHCRPYWR